MGLKKSRFEDVFSNGARIQGEYLRLYALPGQGRLGIATSRKLGSHPIRNKLKRRVREVWRKVNSELDLDFVVMVSQKALTASYPQLCDDLAQILEKMKQRWAPDSECS